MLITDKPKDEILSETNDETNLLLQGIAHEINQPLSSIVNYTQGCINRIEKSHGTQQTQLVSALEKVIKQTQRIGSIMDNFKRLYLFGTLNTTHRHIYDVIQDTTRLLQRNLESQSVQIRYVLGEGLPQLNIDVEQIQQVIFNLLMNAIEAMIITEQDNRIITVNVALEDKHNLSVMFEDTGPGFTEELAKQMGDAFFTTKPQGSGIGLTISRSIIEAHGGEFILQPKSKGQSSAIGFILPIENADAPILPTIKTLKQ